MYVRAKGYEGQITLNRHYRHNCSGDLLLHACARDSSGCRRVIVHCWILGFRASADFSNFSHHHRIRTMAANEVTITATSEITCPKCGHSERETMPTNACQWFYDCKECGEVLKPKPGDCCVYCSYGTVSCPPIQENNNCCA
mgnify:CR=1 FL=1